MCRPKKTNEPPAALIPVDSITVALHSALQDYFPDVEKCFIGILSGGTACTEDNIELYDLFAGRVKGLFPRLFVYIPNGLSTKHIGLIEEALFSTGDIGNAEDELWNTAFDVIKQETPPDIDDMQETGEEEANNTHNTHNTEEEEDDQQSEEEEDQNSEEQDDQNSEEEEEEDD